MTNRSYRRVVSAILLLIATPLALSVVGFARGSTGTPFLARATPRTRCLLPQSTMRNYHMTYLKQRRDQVVRDGNRTAHGERHVMKTCRNCHAHRAQFCDRCHEQAGVNLDCFGCHVY